MANMKIKILKQTICDGLTAWPGALIETSEQNATQMIGAQVARSAKPGDKHAPDMPKGFADKRKKAEAEAKAKAEAEEEAAEA